MELGTHWRGNAGITLCMVVRNEMDQIRACLEDIRDWVTEIVIVDQSSDDGTLEVAKEYTDQVYTVSNKEYADPDRNYCYSLPKTEWLVVLDADERLDFQIKIALPDIIKADIDVFWLKRINVINGYVSRVNGDDNQLRLFRKGAIDYPARMHTHPTIKGKKVGNISGGAIIHLRTLEKIKKTTQRMITLTNEQELIDLQLRYLALVKQEYEMNQKQKGPQIVFSET